MGEGRKFERAVAMRVAGELCRELGPACERLVVAGSLRRGRDSVGDVEVIYVPRVEEGPDLEDFFATKAVDLAEAAIAGFERRGVLGRRKNSRGSEVFGRSNKLMVHLGEGLPVDLFRSEAGSWWNYLVCRTGPAESNMEIAARAKARGFRWNPYGAGFTRVENGEVFRMGSEREVFEFVGLAYREPADR